MRECARKYDEIGVMEVGRGRVLKAGAMEVSSSATSSLKRRKTTLNCEEQPMSHRKDVNSLEYSRSPATSAAAAALDRSILPRLSSTESTHGKDGLRSVDLKADGFETEISTFIRIRFSKETTPASELCADMDDLKSSMTTKPSAQVNSGLKHPLAKVPPAAEIEEFFSTAENYEQKRFAEKYNYDIKKDVPLEGRYEWIRLKP